MPAQQPKHAAVRHERRRRVIVRRRRVRFVSLFVLFTLAMGAYVVMSLANSTAAQVPEAELLAADQISTVNPVDAAGAQHPVFSRLGDTNLVLPVPAQDATIIAYLPLSDEGAESFTPVGEQVNGGVVSRSIEAVFAGDASVRYYILRGSGRVVTETGAVDVGAPPGTPITSPVSGVVVAVKTYKLYGKYDDVQVDIRPEGTSGLTLSVLLLEDPAVCIGQTVDEGKTQLGKVRAPQGDLGERLAELTHDEGSHVHLQVTKDAPQ